MPSSEHEGAEPDSFCVEIKARNDTTITSKTCEKASENSSLRCSLAPKNTIAQTEMENRNPDVNFILEALVGSLFTLTAEGDLLSEDQNIESFKNRTRAVASPIGSVSSKTHQAHHTFSPTQCHVREPTIGPKLGVFFTEEGDLLLEDDHCESSEK